MEPKISKRAEIALKELEKGQLTTRMLNELGYDSHKITKLISIGIIKRVKRGFYTFIDFNELHHLGEKFIFVNPTYAKKIFEFIYARDRFYRDVFFCMFYFAVKAKDFEKAVIYLDDMATKTLKDMSYRCHFYYYLLLLSTLTKLPPHYKDIVKNLRIKDIEVITNGNPYKALENEIRGAFFRGKNTTAYYKQLSLKLERQRNQLQNKRLKDELNFILINESYLYSRNIWYTLYNCIKDDRYDDLTELLEDERLQMTHQLSIKALVHIAQVLMDLKKWRPYPEYTPYEGENFLLAIMQNDFKRALTLNKKYNTLNMDKIEMLLEKVLKFKERNVYTSDDPVVNMLLALLNVDIEIALNFLKVHLQSKGKTEYFDYIKGLIQLSILENDEAYMKPMVALADLKYDRQPDISKYIDCFEEALADDMLDYTKCYLEIIKATICLNLISKEEYLSIFENFKSKVHEKETSPTEDKHIRFANEESNAYLP